MRLAVLKERRAYETRVAATPETVKRLIGLGLTVAIEAGAGAEAAIPDREFAAAGAVVAADAAEALAGAQIVFAVQMPTPEQRALIPRGGLLVCIANAFAEPDLVPALAEAGIDCAAMELLPRITRAQAMDVLSSQANLAGYRAVIEAAGAFQRGFPMMMTAAGTVPPARLFVIGAGVAGLQAIATARRLGAIVSATDVRPAAKEEIKSLGGDLRRCGGCRDRQPDRSLCPRDERVIPSETGGADRDHDCQERSGDLHGPGHGWPRAGHRDAADGRLDAARQRDRRYRRRRGRQLCCNGAGRAHRHAERCHDPGLPQLARAAFRFLPRRSMRATC